MRWRCGSCAFPLFGSRIGGHTEQSIPTARAQQDVSRTPAISSGSFRYGSGDIGGVRPFLSFGSYAGVLDDLRVVLDFTADEGREFS
jgi:hypothetical protein